MTVTVDAVDVLRGKSDRVCELDRRGEELSVCGARGRRERERKKKKLGRCTWYRCIQINVDIGYIFLIKWRMMMSRVRVQFRAQIVLQV